MIKKCLKCGEIKKIAAKGLCNRCYTNQLKLPIIICSSCGERKKQYAKGLCSKCYTKKRVSNIIICKKCGLKKPYFALEMCNSCYNKQRKQPFIKCKNCGKITNKHLKGLCHRCYGSQTKRPIIVCKECGEEKEHKAKGLCKNCYAKHIKRKPKVCICKECGKEGKHCKKGLCGTCYQKQLKYKQGKIPMHLNKSCSNYLGVHVSEEVLSKVFKDVKQMPYHNPGFDFICNKDKKIDVKSSTIHKNKKWEFNIKKNIVADYFLCLAFDDINKLNPMHVWLIPGEIINHLVILPISTKSLAKYYKYEQPIENIIKCCDKMKS